ncbi:hypothetical protein MKEN_00278400 [Mycena kentingensis (nom. inval.)]|nr:hypothetical protein MKEN_00278400 [Mycena kentingensis (nom. inval.)]
MSHPPNCRCSSCHLSSKLFPRTSNDRIMLPPPHPGNAPPNDRARYAPPRPQSTAPGEYRPSYHAQPPMPGSGSRTSFDGAPPPPAPNQRPRHRHTPSQPAAGAHGQPHAHAQHPQYGHIPSNASPTTTYTFAPPIRPASAMAMASPRQRASSSATPPAPAPGSPPNPEWAPTKLKWVQKKERVSHFTPPSQYQGTSFRQYVHEGVPKSKP